MKREPTIAGRIVDIGRGQVLDLRRILTPPVAEAGRDSYALELAGAGFFLPVSVSSGVQVSEMLAWISSPDIDSVQHD